MNVVEIEANNYKPNIRIVSNYIIQFILDKITLYDLFGNKLDIFDGVEYYLKNLDIDQKNQMNDFELRELMLIKDIVIINNNFFIILYEHKICKVKINNNKMVVEISYNFLESIKDIIYLENKDLLAILYDGYLNLLAIENENINVQPIQIIKIIRNTNFLFNFNKNIFISYNCKSISFYNNKRGEKFYQLLNNYKLKGKKQLTKLNMNFLLILNNNNLYLMNIKSMKMNKIYLFLSTGKYEIKFIYSDKHYVYLYINNNIYSIKYLHNQFQIIKSIEMDPLMAINCLSYLQINQNNIIFECVENKKIKSNYGHVIIHIHAFNFVEINLTKIAFLKLSSVFEFEGISKKKFILKREKAKIKYKIKKIKEKNYNLKTKNYFKKNYR